MRYTKRNNKSQKGGMLLESLSSAESETNFKTFISDANPTMLSQGTYGFVTKWELKAGSTNNTYKKIIPTDEFGNKITTLIVKMCCVRPTDEENINEVQTKSNKLLSVSATEFINETNIQTDIYLKTINYLQPICPGIAYANIVPLKLNTAGTAVQHDTLLGKILKRCRSSPDLTQILNPMLNFIVNNPNYKIGIIAMEMAENLTRNDVLTNNDFSNIGRYALLNLALTTGYTHGDFHRGNILICDSTSYFNGVNYRPIVIDFGRSTKLPPDKFNQLKTFVSNHDYISALKILCHSNEFVQNIAYSKIFYGWVCGDYDLNDEAYENNKLDNADIYAQNGIPEKPPALPETINAEIDVLFQAREIAIDANIETMILAHEQDPIKYPLLPVSNQIKNKLFSGLIGGKRKRIRLGKKRQRKGQTRKFKRGKTYNK
jgi:flagellar assembly factor FliW